MLGNIISTHRKKLGLTQEHLAQKLDVTNQAVSKWETDQSCPDVAMLPRLADLFQISMDELFGKEPAVREAVQDLPWEDDDIFRIVLYRGRELQQHSENAKEFTFKYEGPAREVYSELNIECGKVDGHAVAEGNIVCGDVGRYAMAGGNIVCGDVGGYAIAESYVECGNIGGNVTAGNYVECGDVSGSVTSESYVECGAVGGDVNAGGYVECGDVGRSVAAGDYVECNHVGRNAAAGDYVECGSMGRNRPNKSGAPGMSCDNCPGSCDDCGCNGMGCGGMHQNK